MTRTKKTTTQYPTFHPKDTKSIATTPNFNSTHNDPIISALKTKIKIGTQI